MRRFVSRSQWKTNSQHEILVSYKMSESFNDLAQGALTFIFTRVKNSSPLDSWAKNPLLALFLETINKLSLSLTVLIQKVQITTVHSQM
jgi:hypothetical protein